MVQNGRKKKPESDEELQFWNMANTSEILTDSQFQSLEEEKQLLMTWQRLLKSDVAAMEVELKRQAGLTPGGDVSMHEHLVAMNLELSGLTYDQLDFQLLSADGGVSVTKWNVQVTSKDADASLTVSYVTTRDERSRVTCSEVEATAWSRVLEPLLAAAGSSLHRLLFGLYELGRLHAERRAVLARLAGERSGDQLPLPDGRQLQWRVEFQAAEARFQHAFSVTSARGKAVPMPTEVRQVVQERGVEWALGRLQARDG
ncbi:uncharacterized protein LOC119098112 isoform X2 [Pollicipes pollicipes]|uniref:uncharacterized protein LOC119098112 isoform X2 n=1 Tax=Pollicipes pollicipes TaxID=41117 RepID=UPI0018858A3B|nr:uncharacterized protein LOC119098112 isoform X2 [Pollicipes pollicipes]